MTNAQEISTEQWTMVTKKTADWCPNCGQWGWDFKNNLIADFENQNVVLWAAHHDGGLETPTSKAVIDNMPSNGQPVFYINLDNMSVFNSNRDAKRDEFGIIVESLNGFEAIVGVGSEAIYDSGTQTITNTSRAKFLVDSDAVDYYLASYLVDDQLIASQSGQGNNAMHSNILLHSFNGVDHFGVNVAQSGASADDEYFVDGILDFSGESDVPDYADGYSVVTILWYFVDGNYTPINLNRQPIAELVSTDDVLHDVSVAAFHLGAGQVRLNITSEVNIDDATISLFDIQGRTLGSTKASIATGDNTIQLNTQDLPLGTYLVNVQSEQGSKTIKISAR